MNQNQQQQQIHIDPSQTEAVVCNKCGTPFFIPMYMLRKISALISPSGREETIQVPVMACAQCGNPHLPDGFDDEQEESPIIGAK